jgi:hypothetical protein
MKMHAFLSTLVGMETLFEVMPSAQSVETDDLDLVPEMETLP